ncbi:18409_t:CDS:2, partial [Racocetra fulgida]
FENPSWTRQMDLIEKINGKNLIVLVTRMDLLNINEVSQEIRTNKEFIRKLTGSDIEIQGTNKNSNNEWKEHGIELIEMNDKQQMEFENSVGMMKLQNKLLHTLHIHIVKAAEELMNYTSEWKSNKMSQLHKMLKSIESFKDRSELITSFCKEFIVVFQTLFVSPLYTPTIHSNSRLKKFGNEIKDTRETRTEYGWSLNDMWKIFEELRGTNGFTEFPPQDFCNVDFQDYIDDIEKYINSADRLTQEYTLRSSLISLQKLDVKKFVSHQSQNEDLMQSILVSKFKQYWMLQKEDSGDQQNTEKQIAKIMESMGKLKFKKPKLTKASPIDDILWAIYAMFFEKPYHHLKKMLDERTDLLVMTHATSLVHYEDYLMKWAADNLDSAYERAFVVTKQDVSDLVKLSPEENKSNSNKTQPITDSPKNKTFNNLTMENFKWIQNRKKIDKKSQTNSAEETEDKPPIFSTLSETMTDRIRYFMKGKPPDKEDMVKLFINLVDMGRNPDTFDEPESKTNLSKQEAKAVDYVYRRRLTMGISSSITDVIQQLAKMQYEFSHQQTAGILK